MEKDNALPKRKNTRLKKFDYSAVGAYFVTICAQNRKNIFSIIVGEGSPLPQLSHYGKIVDKYIRLISEKYPNMCVERYVIMPNHIHLLLLVKRDNGRGDPSPTIDAVVGWLKYQSTKEINIMRGISSERVFQRSFYDHIIRNQEDYNEIHRYIYENPMRWKLDKLYKEK